MEEFQESDILWSNHDHDDGDNNDDDRNNDECHIVREAHKESANPIKVPAKLGSTRAGMQILAYVINYEHNNEDNNEDDDHGYGDNGDGGEMIPPHVIMAQRIADSASFSVHVGNGRTLKGRDLRRLRNSVLRLTGFLEA